VGFWLLSFLNFTFGFHTLYLKKLKITQYDFRASVPGVTEQSNKVMNDE